MLDVLFSFAGIVGAACCVGMYAAVSLGRASAERPLYFAVNGVGAVLVMVSAWHEFDIGDIGTIMQEIVWTVLSVAGGIRVWRLEQKRKAQLVLAANRPVLHSVPAATELADRTLEQPAQDLVPQRAAS